ncbi:anti-sigma factor [Corynebacterium sp.]|uniref:anti-sigma factor n=1 Tax=Corynebacterium sp. TaxID=1720 RepID=UPI003B3B9C39
MTEPGPDSNRIDELLAGLSLDALDSEEDVREAERLVETDPNAAAVLRRYREVAAELASLHETPPPAELKQAVMRRIGEDDTPSPVSSLRRYRRTAWLMTAVAAVSLAVAVPSLTVAISQHNQSVQAADTTREITRMLTAPDAAVTSTEVTAAEGTESGSLAVITAGGEMAVVARDLPELADERTYQLWSLDADGVPASAGLFDGLDGVITVTTTGVSSDMRRATSAVALTEEPAGGSPAPTTDPVAVLAITGASG